MFGKKYTLEEVKKIYLDHNLKFLDNEYKNAHFKHTSKCLKCHYGSNNEWKVRLHNIQHNKGCPKCAGVLKYTLKQAKQIYLKYNLKFLDKKYKNNITPNLTQCLKCKNVWKICLGNVICDHGCPKCANNIRHTLEQVKQIYLEHNLLFLDNEYKNNSFKINTKCLKCNHEWKTCSDSVKSGSNCPKCRSQNKNEKLTGQFLKELFPNIEIKSKRFDFEIFNENQIKIRNKIFVDYYFVLENQEYIVEYNGRQHYEPRKFGNITLEQAELNFKNQQIRDKFLRNYCQENEIKLIEIDGRIYKNSKIKEYLESKV